MKSRNAIVGGAVALLLTGVAAWAGNKTTMAVQVDTVNKFAQGSLGTARNSSDTTQYIGCWVDSYAGGSPGLVCYAMDSSGTFASCTSSDSTLIAAAGGISGDSKISFFWNTSGNCTYLQVYNNSYWEPKQP